MGRRPKALDPHHLTKRQQEIYDCIIKHVKAYNYPPSVRDLCEATGLKSTSSVFKYLNDLAEMGYLKKNPQSSRAIELTGNVLSWNDEQNVVEVPVVGDIAAGTPILAEENITDYMPYPARGITNKKVFMLKVRGQSMINAGILPGDYILVQAQEECENGEIAAVLIGEEATVKRFYREDGHIRLQPENDAMDPIIVQDCSVMGKVIGLIRTEI